MNTSNRVTRLAVLLIDLTSSSVLEESAALTPVEVEALCHVLRSRQFHVVLTSYVKINDLELALIDQLDRGFAFPEYFGRNWNAVDECLADLSWLSASGFCCILQGTDALKQEDIRVYETFIDVLRTASVVWKKRSIPFKLLCLP